MAVFNINDPLMQSSRVVRATRPPIGTSIDLTVTPAFNSLGTPTAPTGTPSTTGGTLADATYKYRVAARSANGTTLASAESAGIVVTGGGGNGSIALAWTAVTGALSYDVYGRTAGGELFLANVATNAYVDTGAVTPAGALPTVDTTTVITGAQPGQINAGDMVYRTANGGVASLNKPGTANANAATFLGVSEATYPEVQGLGQGVTISRPAGDTTPVRIPVRTGGQFQFKTTPGETYNPGDAVYLGADAQTVSTVATGTSVGKVANDQAVVGWNLASTATGGDMGTGAQGLAGAAGQNVVIEIIPPAAVNQ